MKQMTFNSFKNLRNEMYKERELQKLIKQYIRFGYSKHEAEMKARYNK